MSGTGVFRRAVIAAVLLVSCPFFGCKGDPLKKVQVTGKVTFDGGACPEPGRITFTPTAVAEGLPRRPASGAFEVDGAYVATSFRPGDGIVPGTYSVSVACYKASMLSGAPGDDRFRAASFVAEEFEPQELVVPAGSKPIQFDIDVPKRNPSK